MIGFFARKLLRLPIAALLVVSSLSIAEQGPDKLLWGDVHLHTNMSWDAYYNANQTGDLDVAYRFAKGLPVVHPFHRARVRIDRPLDFLAVTDHAEFLGLPYSLLADKDPRLTATRLGKYITAVYERGGEHPGVEALISMILAFQTSMLPPPGSNEENAATRFPPPPPQVSPDLVGWLLDNRDIWAEFNNAGVRTSNWKKIVDAADRYNQPGQFTALVGWEYSPQANGGNLHRVVLTPADGVVAKTFSPFSFLDSDNPADLWDWLDATKKQTGADFVAIPHNSNISMGAMFSRVDFNGEPLSRAYAEQRSHWETVAEVTQVKGSSETHPLLAPTDEFAGFEVFNHQLASFKDAPKHPSVSEADFIRSALKTGLELEASLGVNPFKLGMIGSTDSHTGLSSTEEDNFLGKYGEGSTPEEGGKPIADFNGYTNWDLSSSGLAAVWAKENTREEIVAAFKRREVYGTSGPRISVRFFAGYHFSEEDVDAENLVAAGYAKGVPMGGDLFGSANATPPHFLVRAVKDPDGAGLDRVQVIKGWTDRTGEAQEKIFEVVWAGDRQLNSAGKLPPIDSSVDIATASYSNTQGSNILSTLWIDPEFNPAQRAFYYLRVLEIPTPRHSLYDAIALGAENYTQHPVTLQERAYSSPIWYSPASQTIE